MNQKLQTLEQVDVYVAGADGVDTYRIPSLLVTSRGTLLAFCEARKQSGRDASPTDMVLKRSTDGGRTWGPMQVVVRGEGDEAIMNPCPVAVGDRVVLVCMNAHKTERGRHRQLVLTSDDDGATWSAPVDITGDIVEGDDAFIPGPGVSIVMRTGRIVTPGYTNEYANDATRTCSRSRAIYSDDAGRTWRLGEPVAFEWSNESQVVELNDGSLRLNFRVQVREPDGHPGFRGTAISDDAGQTWREPTLDRALNEAPCQAGLVRYEPAGTGTLDRLLFSNPDARPGPDGGARTRMTVRLSEDGGATWPHSRLIHPGPSVYSCPAALPDGDIALLYECGHEARHERIALARFTLDWLKGD